MCVWFCRCWSDTSIEQLQRQCSFDWESGEQNKTKNKKNKNKNKTNKKEEEEKKRHVRADIDPLSSVTCVDPSSLGFDLLVKLA